MSKKGWFAVKSLFRTEVLGEPVGADEEYDAEGTLIEERVVLVRARSLDDALSRGEKEADEYSEDEHVNPYGQTVKWRRIKILEASYVYPLDDKMPEVWSSTSVIPASVADAELEVQRFGPAESADALGLRRKYLDAQLRLPSPPKRGKHRPPKAK
jgi:hypothetical protein